MLWYEDFINSAPQNCLSAAVIGSGHGADVLRSGQKQGDPPKHSDLWIPLQRPPDVLCCCFPNLTCHAWCKVLLPHVSHSWFPKITNVSEEGTINSLVEHLLALPYKKHKKAGIKQ